MSKNIIDIIEERRSCRAFEKKEIPKEILNQLFNAAAKAPSGGGFQAVSIIAVTDDDKKEALKKLSGGQGFITQAPINLVFCIDYSRIKRICDIEPSPFDFTNHFVDFWMGIIDASVMAHQVCLAAESFDLGSVYVGNLVYNIEASSELLKLPEYVSPVIMLSVGYPKSEGKLSPKYSTSVLVHNNEYQSLSDETLMSAFHEKNKKWQMKPKKKIVDAIYKTAYEQKGEVFADSVVEWIEKNERITPYQYWFGAYYTDEGMLYSDYVKYMRKQGFNWLE